MREVQYNLLLKKIKSIVYKANFKLPEDVKRSLVNKKNKEKGRNKKILDLIIENFKYAEKNEVPLCQDTGMAVFFVEVGEDVKINGGTIRRAITQATQEIYSDYYLRKSVVNHPFIRKNTADNTPPVIHFDIIKGSKIKISFMPKGGGSENMSRLKMFNPSVKKEKIVDFIYETVREAGPNPCPPTILGVGIGGTFDYAPYLAKKALLRSIGERNKDTQMAKLEKEITSKINKKSNIGIQGLGGKTTVLDTFIEYYPCHIASLPVAVNINCHSARHAEVVI